MDCLKVRYFQLIELDSPELHEAEEHARLSVDQDPKVVLREYGDRLEKATKAVLL